MYRFYWVLMMTALGHNCCRAQEDPLLFRIAKYKDDKTCAISYTFDDGLREHYTLVAPKLKALGFRATFWINGSKINPGAGAIKDTTRMTWAELKEMAKDGNEISNHGWAHKNFGKYNLEELREDIARNDSAIYHHIGIMPSTFCYPNNAKTPEGVRMASEHRVGTRTVQHSVGSKSTPQNLQQWVDTLLRSREWGVTMTHGITYGYDHFRAAAILWEHLERVKALEDQIWVGTFHDIAAYTKERDLLQYDIRTKRGGFVITPRLELDEKLFTEPLTGVIEGKGIRNLKIRQGKKKLKLRVTADKVLFDFNPYGGELSVTGAGLGGR
ncbi:polysaccharide deacetylase family protein [Niabella aurantiaca]|uniref:polysaccharide deacetylase family protein n=1 Tax=Niabella aurantiaca TaxID=379900 RepID=UPI0003687294|nr:polysaccharide deacetylase family protein [Niabella aurantiaca]